MRRSGWAPVALAAALAPALVALARTPVPPVGRALSLPALDAGGPLPLLPERSPRNANYKIDARLDPETHRIQGSLVLEWRNDSGVALQSFPFHLYWNAFRNNLSTSARGRGRRAARLPDLDPERGFGYTQVRSVRLLGEVETDLTPTLRYIQPDDGNPDDRSVMEVRTPAPLAPGATARFKVEWTSRIPHGVVGRAGWVHDYNFVVQWFPKIGVFWNGAWNCHQFHATTEFFADYGVYDVALTLPAGFVVGATGLPRGEPARNADGTMTHRFFQEDVHDFAWTASPRFLERHGRFEDPGYPSVDIRLLLQPEHAALADRYIEATKICLRHYGAWSAPYPYPHITVVDPAWMSASGGMEYPTLFTGGANVLAPPAAQNPESVTIHEAGHQFWYGLVGNNEFEEAWLDEGFNRYHDIKTTFMALGPKAFERRYFGLREKDGRIKGGIPVIAPGVRIGRGESVLRDLRESGEADVLARRAWEYLDPDSYALNSYGKPALTLQTLEGLVGDETMTRILRTYARRQRFAHPTTRDFIQTVDEVTGKDYGWFFDETFFSSGLVDYTVTVKNDASRTLEGYDDAPGEPKLHAVLDPGAKAKLQESGPFDPEVVVRRLGEARLPVELRVEFADGKVVDESWDGQYRWRRFVYPRHAKVRRATVDPEGKIALDVNPANNSWVDDKGVARRAASKWSARFLLWLQTFLELHMVLG
jgi:Peptidase family M1 domain